MASGYPTTEQSMACLASFFDNMSGVKKQPYLFPAINCPTLANEYSIIPPVGFTWHFVVHWDTKL